MSEKSPLRPAPPDPAALLDVLSRLADLMTHETALLSAGQVQQIALLQREKLRLTALYQQAIKDAQQGMISFSPALRAEVVAASARLAEAAVQNERALRIGRAATRRLIDMVVASIRSRVEPLQRYTRKRLTRSPVGPAMAFALDRRL